MVGIVQVIALTARMDIFVVYCRNRGMRESRIISPVWGWNWNESRVDESKIYKMQLLCALHNHILQVVFINRVL